MARSPFRAALIIAILAASVSFTLAQRALYSIENSTRPCIFNSSITADPYSLIIAYVNPDDNVLTYSLFGETTYTGPILFDFIVTVNNQTSFNTTQDPCTGISSAQLCPASPGELILMSSIEVPSGELDGIPDEVYTMKDPDANFRYVMRNATSREVVGCLQIDLSNAASLDANSTETGDGSANGTANARGNGGSAGNSTENGNGTGTTNETGGAQNGESGASTAYLNWTLLGSAMIALACGTVF